MTHQSYAIKMGFTEFVQPDYEKWAAVQMGMSRDEVVALLGPPLDNKYSGGKARPTDAHYSYGYLQMPMVPHPRTYEFLVSFDGDGEVDGKIDPFNGRFSVDGSPTSPEIIIPTNHTVFSHYPRILDCRWYPSSGIYPMTYTFELGAGDSFDAEGFSEEFHEESYKQLFDQEIETDLAIPFFMTDFVGAQPGRFRVKAKNKIGESDWSEYRYFSFTV